MSKVSLEAQSGSKHTSIRSEAFFFGLLVVVTVLLACPRLEGYPRLDFDEGYYLQLAKNMALRGEYALSSQPQEADWFGLGNSSPTLGLPIALVFKFWGVGVTQGRLVSVFYLLGAMVAAYALARHLYDWPTAALGAALFLVSGPSIGFNSITVGRRVLGEVPMLFFVLSGAWAWFRSWERDNICWLIGAGLLFGLALATKEQFAPLLLLTGGLTWLADRVYYRKLQARHSIVPLVLSGIPLSVWYAYKLAVLEPEAFSRHLATLSAVSRASTWLFMPHAWSNHIGFFYSNAFLLPGLLGVLYALALAARRDLRGLKSLFLSVLVIASLTWFTFFSIGWWRYAYPGLALSGILAAKLLSDLIAGLPLAPARLWAGLTEGKMAKPVIAAIVTVGAVANPLLSVTPRLFSRQDLSPQEFAAYVEAHTEPSALIESFAWEIDFLSDRRYHHPPADVFVQLLRNDPNRMYNPLSYRPQYLIDGPYSKGSGLYPEAWLTRCCRKIGTVGPYDLYAVLNVNTQ